MFHPSIHKHLAKMGSVLLLVFFYIALPQPCRAQTAIKGTVVDDYGYPVQGAMVHSKGKKTGVVTSRNGSFELPATPGTVLVFECTGYNPTQVKAGMQGPLFVRLFPRYLRQTVAPAISTVTAGDTIYIPYN